MSIKHVVTTVLHVFSHHHAPHTAFSGHSLSVMLHVPKHYHAPKLSNEQRERALALTMFGEARSLGPRGMLAVGFVVVNRVRIGQQRFSDFHIDNVVWARKQFSCWNGRDPNRNMLGHIAKAQARRLDHLRWMQAKILAHRIMHGQAGRDFTYGATLYHTKAIRPYWVTRTIQRTAVIGSHVFYKSVTKRMKVA